MILNNFSGGPYKSENVAEDKVAIYKADEKVADGASSEKSTKDEVKEEAIIDNNIEKKAASNDEKPSKEFKSTIVKAKELPSYEMVWENSLDGKKSAAIDTMKEQDVDFGMHVIYVKDIKTSEIVKYEVINNNTQFTTRNIEWWDNEHLIVVKGLAYGTVAKGSDVYSLEVDTGNFFTLYQVKDQKQQIVDIQKDKNDLILELLIYEDDNYNISHKGVGKMNILDPSKPVDMQIISEEKK
jgi:hypothetical protein